MNDSTNGTVGVSQKIAVVRHMAQIGAIDQMTAMQRYGCARLASRINDLRKDGFDILGDWVHYCTADQVKKRYMRYLLRPTERNLALLNNWNINVC